MTLPQVTNFSAMSLCLFYFSISFIFPFDFFISTLILIFRSLIFTFFLLNLLLHYLFFSIPVIFPLYFFIFASFFLSVPLFQLTSTYLTSSLSIFSIPSSFSILSSFPIPSIPSSFSVPSILPLLHFLVAYIGSGFIQEGSSVKVMSSKDFSTFLNTQHTPDLKCPGMDRLGATRNAGKFVSRSYV